MTSYTDMSPIGWWCWWLSLNQRSYSVWHVFVFNFEKMAQHWLLIVSGWLCDVVMWNSNCFHAAGGDFGSIRTHLQSSPVGFEHYLTQKPRFWGKFGNSFKIPRELVERIIFTWYSIGLMSTVLELDAVEGKNSNLGTFCHPRAWSQS